MQATKTPLIKQEINTKYSNSNINLFYTFVAESEEAMDKHYFKTFPEDKLYHWKIKYSAGSGVECCQRGCPGDSQCADKWTGNWEQKCRRGIGVLQVGHRYIDISMQRI